MPRLLLFIIVSLLPALSHARYFVTEHLLINDGQSNNFVQDLAYDQKGRLWIATASGLALYDGNSFSTYNVSNSQISANMINRLWCDDEHSVLWIGTKGMGIDCLDFETLQIRNYNTPDSLLSNVLDISMSDDGHLWLISPKQVMLLDRSAHTLTPIDTDHDDLNYRCGADDGNGNLIIGTHMQSARVLDTRTHRLRHLTFGIEEGQRVNVNRIYMDHTGRIWVATNIGLWYYLPGSSELLPFEGLSGMEIFNLVEIDNRELWAMSNRGIRTIDLNTYQVTRLKTEGSVPLLQDVQAVCEDTHGNIWIGNKGLGIEFISQRDPYFEKLHASSFWGIYQDDSITWVGARGRVLGFEGKVCTAEIPLPDYDNAAVFSINGDGGDWLYLAVPYNCLALNKATHQLRPITTTDRHPLEALTFYREEGGTLWISATDGVYRLLDSCMAERLPISQQLNRQSANGIRRDKQGKLWVATYENGLYVFDADYRLLTNLTRQQGFCSNSIQHLKFDSQGRLWMSTPDGPCCIPDTRYPEQYVSYGNQHGLVDTYTRAIQEDRHGNIWMSTNNGISMLDVASQTFVNYSQADYLPVNNMNGGAVMQPDGGIVFTSRDGLCHCYPDSLTRLRLPDPLRLISVTSLFTSEQGLSQEVILPDAEGQYHLQPDRGSFRIAVGSVDYAENQFLEFEYQMEDFNHQWLPCYRRIVTFRNLGAGKYIINVRARFKGQPWSQCRQLKVVVIIHHPWWSSLWARILYFLVFASLVTVVVQHYRNRLRLKAELELVRQKNIDQHLRNTERLQFFANITHELKTPLTLIQAPLEDLLQDHHLPEPDQKRLQLVYDSSLRLTDLCNKLLDFRKSETHNFRLVPSRGRLGDLVRELGNSFIELNTNPQVTFSLEVCPDEEPLLFDPDILRAILTNLLSNAFKYTPQGTIRLAMEQRVEEGHRYSILTVSDTGYGIPAKALKHIFDRYYKVDGPHQASGTGIGLAIVRVMADLHHIRIETQSQEGQGTTFTLTLDHEQAYPNVLPDAAAEVSNETAAASEAEATSAADADPRPLLLLVEDDYQILHFMSEALSADYRILAAHHGQEGLDLAIQHNPDLIITDLMMPVMDGNTLCRQIKGDLRTSHIPVIMLTAKETADDQMQGYADGADSYLTKPFSLKMLHTRIDNMISARQRLVTWCSSQGISQLQSAPQPAAQPEPLTLSSVDQQFLQEVEQYIVDHISANDLRMEDIAQSLRISHSTLYRKIKALTGFSGAEYLRRVRILHSAHLMRHEHFNVSEAAYHCGFSNLAYFRTAFREVFGVSPSEYLKK